MTMSKAVLIAGCSTGIGRATALQLARSGYPSTPPHVESVSKAIERSLTARRPRTRYLVTAGARLMIGLRRWLPDRAFDAFLRTQFPVPGK